MPGKYDHVVPLTVPRPYAALLADDEAGSTSERLRLTAAEA